VCHPRRAQQGKGIVFRIGRPLPSPLRGGAGVGVAGSKLAASTRSTEAVTAPHTPKHSPSRTTPTPPRKGEGKGSPTPGQERLARARSVSLHDTCSLFVLDNSPKLGYGCWRPPHEGRARGVGCGRRMRSLAVSGLARPEPQRSRDRKDRRETGSGRPRRPLLSLARTGSGLLARSPGAARQGALSRGAVGMGQTRSPS
jgi:hypothetical protein